MKKYLFIALMTCSSVMANNTGYPGPKSTISISQFGGFSIQGSLFPIVEERLNFHNQSAVAYHRHLYSGFWIVGNLGVNTWRDYTLLSFRNEQGIVVARNGLSNHYNSAFAGLGLTYQVRFTRRSQLNFTVIGNCHNRYSDYSVVVKTENIEMSKDQRKEFKENSNPGAFSERESFQLVFNPNFTGRLKKFGMKNELRWQAGLYVAYSFHDEKPPEAFSFTFDFKIEDFLATGLQLGLVYAW